MINSRKTVYITLLLLAFSLCGCGSQATNPENSPQESEIASELTTETESVETTETIEEETESTEMEVITEEVPLSYNEQIQLDFVDRPKKRDRAEAIAYIKELSRWYPALNYVYENADRYPIELLLSGCGNPEMAHFLYGYLSSDGTLQGGFTDQEQPEDYPLFLQFDVRWGYLQYGSGGTVGSSGCGPTCLSMAIFYLTGDRTCTPGIIAQYSLENGHYVDGVGTAWSLLTHYPTLYGLNSRQITWNEDRLKGELDQGRILVCSVRPGDFTSGGHFIVIYGYDENGFKINNPKCVYRSQLSWTYEQIQDDIKATWTIGH